MPKEKKKSYVVTVMVFGEKGVIWKVNPRTFPYWNFVKFQRKNQWPYFNIFKKKTYFIFIIIIYFFNLLSKVCSIQGNKYKIGI